MKVMSFDQSISKTGWALYDYESKTLLDYGLIKSDPKFTAYREDAIHKMASDLLNLAKTKNGEVFSFEDVYMDFGKSSSNLPLAMLAGAVVEAFKSYNDSLIFPITAKEWKSYCGIQGQKRKDQKQNTMAFVKDKFGVMESEDVCDAIAQGWAVVNKIKMNEKAQ